MILVNIKIVNVCQTKTLIVLSAFGICGIFGILDQLKWREIGGFHSHRGTPIAGWFISWKIPI